MSRIETRPDQDETAESDGARRGYKVPAAGKALDILEFMAGCREDVTQTEISVALGRSIHEVYRIIQMLEGRGYLIRTRSDRYRLSLKLFELAHMHPPINRLIDAALPVMRALVGRIDQSCHLVVVRGLTVLIILQVESPLPMRYSVALGAHFPILETSSGAVLLAFMPPDERDSLIDRLLAEEEFETDRTALEARLAGIVAGGYEIHASMAVEGCTNISLPIRDHTDATIAALTVPYLPQKQARFDPQAVLATTRDAANEISRALGAPERPVTENTNGAPESAKAGGRKPVGNGRKT